ncbi:quinate 5-dehydrogenase [Gelria sp. Kuro-4]|uniref:quinate 5-dehydrogenase n=1 Tax=Gelria sp. Kuro-4 TaxID=2796927 RepID=UPI001BEF95AA|nr:quinate 5-dehydrogenase [Gelria sp. Kuro-4]BCV23396.1 hypothetical protein kuro4_01690 [Gelria sp. Kuro-4]
MKHVVSVSLGSSKRNHKVEAEFLGEKFLIERIGTDGDMEKAITLLKELDGKVDAFGMGGIDLYLVAGERRYAIRDAQRLARAAAKTPIVDGSGLKNTLERRVIRYLATSGRIPLAGKKALLVSGVDRWGMAEGLTQAGCRLTIGDLMFGLGIPVPLKSLTQLKVAAALVAPILVRLPFEMLYPTGKKQEEIKPRFSHYYLSNDIIAGDFLFIKRHLPPELPGKVIITNTVTSADVEDLKRRGVRTLVTTTPELNGRSFGTNVMEGVLVSLATKPWQKLGPADYEELLDRLDLKPRIEDLN